VSLARGIRASNVVAFVDERRTAVRVAQGRARFVLRADGGKPVDWAVTG